MFKLDFLVFVFAWSLSGIALSPFVTKILSREKETFDKSTLVYFALLGPIPTLYILAGIASTVAGAAIALFASATFWIVGKIYSVFFK